MIHEISEDEFDHFTAEVSKVEYLQSYVMTAGLVVFKQRSGEKYYVHDPYGNFQMDDLASLDYFVKNRDKFKKDTTPKKIEAAYAGMIPEGARFPESTFVRIGKLGQMTGTPLANGKVLRADCLQLVDAYLNGQGYQQAFRKRYFIDFLALLGEAVIDKYKGHCEWKMTLSEVDGVSWSPDVYYDGEWLSLDTRLEDNLLGGDWKNPLQQTMKTMEVIIDQNIKGRHGK